MEEVSSSIPAPTWTNAANLVSFATNLRTSLGPIFAQREDVNAVAPALALMLAEAEVERISFCTKVDFELWTGLCAALRSSPTVSFLTVDSLSDEDLAREPRLVPTLAAALRNTKPLNKLRLWRGASSLGTLDALVELLGPRSDIQVWLSMSPVHQRLVAPLVESMRRIHSLYKLYIRFTRIYAEPFSSALRNDWRNMQKLVLIETNMGAEGGKAVGGAIDRVASGLRVLDLRKDDLPRLGLSIGQGCEEGALGDEGIAGIVDGLIRGYNRTREKSGVLQKLYLNENNICEPGGIKVAQLVKANPHLKCIRMTANPIRSSGAALGEALRSCAATLRVLILEECALDAKAVAAISRSLSKSYSLTVLDISHSQLKESAEAMRVMAHELLAGAKSLEELHIHCSDIDGPGARELAEGFAMSSSLKILEIGFNDGVGAEATAVFDSILRGGSQLTELVANYCQIGDDGCGAIARLVAALPSLLKLDISCDDIGTDGGKEIFQAVALSSSLDDLSLESNKLGDLGGKYISEWIIGRSKVSQLNIRYIGMSVEGTKAVAKAVTKAVGKTALKKIELGGNNAGGSQMVFRMLKDMKELVAKSINIEL